MSITENEGTLEKLLTDTTLACRSAAAALHAQMVAHRDVLPTHYIIPAMSVELKMEMSYSDGKIKGWFANKQSSEKHASSMSSIKLEIVSMPKPE